MNPNGNKLERTIGAAGLLIIPNANVNDSGYYTCVGVEKSTSVDPEEYKTDSAKVFLKVKKSQIKKPRNMEITLNDERWIKPGSTIDVLEHSYIKISCTAEGDHIQYTWIWNTGAETYYSYVIINSASHKIDTGFYECEAKNAQGYDKVGFYLSVNCE